MFQNRKYLTSNVFSITNLPCIQQNPMARYVFALFATNEMDTQQQIHGTKHSTNTSQCRASLQLHSVHKLHMVAPIATDEG